MAGCPDLLSLGGADVAFKMSSVMMYGPKWAIIVGVEFSLRRVRADVPIEGTGSQ
jgi:hypothetical protein